MVDAIRAQRLAPRRAPDDAGPTTASSPSNPRTRPVLVRADKAYSARGTRGYLRRRGIKAVIPEPADQAGHRKRRGSRGGRPVTYDRLEYAGRNVVERGFNVLKQWRALATRYDKHALTYRGGVVLAAILTWTHDFRDTP